MIKVLNFPSALLAVFVLIQTLFSLPAVAGTNIQVYVSYAENERPAAFFPNPWYGSPNTIFLGYPGPAYDSGGVLIVNTGPTPVVLGHGATVDGFRNGHVYKLWDGLIPNSGLTIAPGKQVILAQTFADNSPVSCTRKPRNCFSNFDTSDTPVNSPQATNMPVIHLVLDGVTETFTDTAQVLNTGGADIGNTIKRNESMQWRRVGTTGPLFPGGSGVRPAPVSTWHNDNARTGLNPTETTLRPENVNAATFGKLFTHAVDGQIYGQPLFIPDVVIPNKGLRNVVVVATENNSVYAFDAETNTDHGGILWGPISLGAPVPSAEICSVNVSPTFGVTGTPVVDPATGTVYVVSKNKVATGVYAARLHALDLSSGVEKLGGHVDINGSVTRTGGGTATVAFDAHRHFQRSALLLHGGVVYVAFGSHCDQPDFHGWMFGYNAANITKQTAIFNSTPNAVTRPGVSGCSGYKNELPAGGAIWMAGAGPAADGSGIFATTGNGRFDGSTPGGMDYADTLLKLTQPGPGIRMTVADYFTPYNQQTLECNDDDFGSSGPLLVPGSKPSLLVQTSKYGDIYLINTTTGSMGEFDAGCKPSGPACDHVVQVLGHAIRGEVQGSPAYFDDALYFQGQADTLKKFNVVQGKFSPVTPVAQSVTASALSSTPSISADANALKTESTGIVWSIEKASGAKAVLHAYTTDTLRELYNSDAQGVRDTAGTTANFTVPTVAAGKVFVGTKSQLVVYGAAFFTSWSGQVALGGSAKQIAVGQNQNGQLDVFYTGPDDAIYHNLQNLNSQTGWSGALPLGGHAKSIAVVADDDGRLELFHVGENSAIYRNHQIVPNGSWSGEIALGGYATQITVSKNQDGRLELIYVGRNGEIHHNYQMAVNGTWSGDKVFGGYASYVTAATGQDGRLQVFYVGLNSAIYRNYQLAPNSSWSGEVALGGQGRQIAVARNLDGRLQIVYVGTNNSVYTNEETAVGGRWNGETQLGGYAEQIAEVRNKDGRLEVFYVGRNAAINHNYQIVPGGAWNGEAPLDGNATQISVGENLDGRLEMFYLGSDARVYHDYQTVPSSRWSR